MKTEIGYLMFLKMDDGVAFFFLFNKRVIN